MHKFVLQAPANAALSVLRAWMHAGARLLTLSSKDGICCPHRLVVGAVVVAPVARKANALFSNLKVVPDLDQNHAVIGLVLRIALDGVSGHRAASCAPVFQCRSQWF